MCVCNWKCLYKLSLAGDTRRTRSACVCVCVCVCVSQYVCVCVCVSQCVRAHRCLHAVTCGEQKRWLLPVAHVCSRCARRGGFEAGGRSVGSPRVDMAWSSRSTYKITHTSHTHTHTHTDGLQGTHFRHVYIHAHTSSRTMQPLGYSKRAEYL